MMMIRLDQRILVLEELPAPQRVPTPEQVLAGDIDRARRCGFSEAEVMAKFGDWPAFYYAVFKGEVVDPDQKDYTAEIKELLERPCGDRVSAYLELVKGPASRG
jgi:hypothetical protein